MSKIKCINYRLDFNNLQARQKSLKKYWIVGIEYSKNDNTESPLASVPKHYRFMLCNLQTDPTHAIH